MIPPARYKRTVDPGGDDSLAMLLRQVSPGATILELGPATGYFTQYLRDVLSCPVDCVELSPEMAAAAAPFARRMVVGDLDQLDLERTFEPAAYDIIIAADVIEHLRDPERTLAQCRALLKPDGRLLLSVPNIGHAALVADLIDGRFEYRADGLLDRTHLRFFTRESLVRLLRDAGFEIGGLGAVRVMPQFTEFRRDLEALAPAVRDWLLGRPDALTYQFIVSARAGAMDDEACRRWMCPVDLPAQVVFCAKLYWADADQPFGEERALARFVPMGPERQSIRFDLPDDARVRRLRFDPGDRPGFFHLFSVRLLGRGADGSEEVQFRWDGAESIVRRARLDNVFYCRDALGELFLGTSDDPMLAFDVPGAPRGLSVVVEMDWPMSADALVVGRAVRRQEEESRLQLAEARADADRAAALAAQLATELEQARDRAARLEAKKSTARAASEKAKRAAVAADAARGSRVDLMVVSYHSARWITGFFEALRSLEYPADRLRLVFVDNASADESLARAREEAASIPFDVEWVRNERNLGFTGGYAAAFARGRGDYYFVVNIDTRIAPDALARLVRVLDDDPTAGIAEARQTPLEHPKYYDPLTGETSWCSGACCLVRAAALHAVGGGFDDLFFMYGEDVDLSWRMWLHGWRCLYVPQAEVTHFTEQLDPERSPRWQHYFSMRNGALMRLMYARPRDVLLHYAAMIRVCTLSRNPLWHRWLTFKAVVTSLERLPAAWRRRRLRARAGSHPWVFFNGWLYGRHARDPCLAGDAVGAETSGLSAAPAAAVRRPGLDATAAGAVRSRRDVRTGGSGGHAAVVLESDGAPGHGMRPRGHEPMRSAVDANDDEPGSGAGMEPLVSIVVPTHNRARLIPRTVARIMAQDFPSGRFELLLVDSNSSDRTPATCSALHRRYPGVRPLHCDRSGAAAARNLGLQHARGRLIVLLDDDILVPPDLLSRLWTAHGQTPQAVLLGHIIAPWDDATDPFHRYLHAAQEVNRYDFSDPDRVTPQYFYTACVAIPRDTLGDLRFDEGFQVYGVEDIEFGFRLLRPGVDMRYLPEVRVCHEYFPALGAYRLKKLRAGYSLGYFLDAHPHLAGQFTFGPRFEKYAALIRLAVRVAAPFAAVLRAWEHTRYRTGPLPRALMSWYYYDLRTRLHAGARRFRRGLAPS